MAVQKEMRKGLDSLIILVAWEIWKHRNDCVFEKVRPTIQEVLRAISNEGGLWCMAGDSRLRVCPGRHPWECRLCTSGRLFILLVQP